MGEGPPKLTPDNSMENLKGKKPDSPKETAEQTPGQFVAPPSPADDDKAAKESKEKKPKKPRKKSSESSKKIGSSAPEENPVSQKEEKAETEPQKIFERALGALAKEKNFDDSLINDIRAFTDFRGFDPKKLERQIRLMRLMELNEKDEKLADAITEIIKVIKEKPNIGKRVGGEKIAGSVERKEKGAEIRKDEPADKVEILKRPHKISPLEAEKAGTNGEKKEEWELGIPENMPPDHGPIELGSEDLDKEITELQKNIDETETKIAGGKVPVEEIESEIQKLAELQERLERRQKQRGVEPELPSGGDEPPEGEKVIEPDIIEEEAEPTTASGKELMAIRDRVIAQMAQGQSLVKRRMDLEKLGPRTLQEQGELDAIIRAERIDIFLSGIAVAEGKGKVEYWAKYGPKLYRGYDKALQGAMERDGKEPDAAAFMRKLIEYLPQEENPVAHEIKEKSPEIFKKIADHIGEIIKEKDPKKREEKSGQLGDLEKLEPLIGKEGAQNLFKIIAEVKEKRGRGQLTEQEAEEEKKKLEKAKGELGASMEKAWSILGLVGIMLLLGLIFMIIVELEAIDYFLKQGKGGKH